MIWPPGDRNRADEGQLELEQSITQEGRRLSSGEERREAPKAGRVRGGPLAITLEQPLPHRSTLQGSPPPAPTTPTSPGERSPAPPPPVKEATRGKACGLWGSGAVSRLRAAGRRRLARLGLAGSRPPRTLALRARDARVDPLVLKFDALEHCRLHPNFYAEAAYGHCAFKGAPGTGLWVGGALGRASGWAGLWVGGAFS